MDISETIVRAYQEVHKQKYGEEITYDEAVQNINTLKELIRIMCGRDEDRDDEGERHVE